MRALDCSRRDGNGDDKDKKREVLKKRGKRDSWALILTMGMATAQLQHDQLA